MERSNNEMMTAEDKLKAALMEILNHSDNLCKFSEVFESFDTLAHKTMTIEFKFFDIETQSSDVLQEENVKLLSIPLASTLTQVGLTFCPFPRCSPPPGKFI